MNSGFPALRVELDRLRYGPVEWSGELSADADAWGLDGVELLEGPRLTFTADAGGSGGVRVKGAMAARISLTCRRCLRGLERRIGIEFDFRFDPAVEAWDEADGVFGLDPEAASLDLSDPLREELLLALPGYPECPEGCGGLCPMCGADLDETDCGCSREEPDPRWNALRRLVPDGQLRAAEPDDEVDGHKG